MRTMYIGKCDSAYLKWIDWKVHRKKTRMMKKLGATVQKQWVILSYYLIIYLYLISGVLVVGVL